MENLPNHDNNYVDKLLNSTFYSILFTKKKNIE